MTDIAFTKEEFELEKQRRLRQKCDERQLAFSPHTELGLWKFCQFMCPDFYTDDRQPLIELTEIFRRVTLGELRGAVNRPALLSLVAKFGKTRLLDNVDLV